MGYLDELTMYLTDFARAHNLELWRRVDTNKPLYEIVLIEPRSGRQAEYKAEKERLYTLGYQDFYEYVERDALSNLLPLQIVD